MQSITNLLANENIGKKPKYDRRFETNKSGTLSTLINRIRYPINPKTVHTLIMFVRPYFLSSFGANAMTTITETRVSAMIDCKPISPIMY